jgi:hypothetical protein
MTTFTHDSELPDELCDDLDCPDHHPRCYWESGYGCNEPAVNRLGGHPWCADHTVELRSQIDALKVLDPH